MIEPVEMEMSKAGDKITAYHILLFGICLLSNVLGGTVSVLMSVYLPEVVQDLVGQVDAEELNYLAAYINSVFIFGWAFGGIVWGILSDRIGRTYAIIFSIGSYGVFTLLTGMTESWWLIVVFRFLSGFSVGGVLVVTPTVLSEVWPERTRSIFIGILSIGFPIGIFSAGLINVMVDNWHQAFYVGSIPLLLSIASLLVVRESDKWRSAKATHVNKGWVGILEPTNRSNIFIGSITFGTMLIGLWAIFSWMPTWIQSLAVGVNGQRVSGLSMMVLGAGGLTGGFLSGWLSNAIGLRKAMMVCFAGCSFMSFLLFKMNTVFGGMIYVEIVLLALFFGASQGILSAYIPELFPPAIRATATGFCFNLGRFITGSVVFFVGALVTVLGGYGNAIFIFSLVFVIGWITTLFSKEVKAR